MIDRGIEMTERRGIRGKQLMDGLKEKRGYWNLKAESIDLPALRTPCRSD
jgi:hypothetical protein